MRRPASTPRGARGPNRYTQLLEHLFELHYKQGATEVEFDRAEMQAAAEKLGIQIPDNPYDIVYSFRHRATMPEAIRAKAPDGQQWILRTVGGGKYRFVAISVEATILPDPMLAENQSTRRDTWGHLYVCLKR